MGPSSRLVVLFVFTAFAAVLGEKPEKVEVTTDIPPTTLTHRSFRKFRSRKNKTVSVAAEAEALEVGVRRLAAALEHPDLVLQLLREEDQKENSFQLTTLKTTIQDEITTIEPDFTTTEISTEIPDETNYVTRHLEPPAFTNKTDISSRRRKPGHSSRRRSRARQSKNRQYNRISKFRREPSPYLLPPYANTFSDYRRPQHYRPKPTPLPNISERPLPLVDSDVEKRFFEPLQKKITIDTKEENSDAKYIKDDVEKMEQIQHYQEQGHYKPSGDYIPNNKKKFQVHQEALAHFASIINVTNTQESPTNSKESEEVQTTAEDYNRHYRKQTEEERKMLMETRRRLETHRKDTESGEDDLASYRRFLKEHEAQLRQERERLEAEERRELWERIRRREEERRLAVEEAQRKKVNEMLDELSKKAENHTLLMDQAFDYQNDKIDNDWPIATTFEPRGFMLPHEINKALEVTKKPLIIPSRRRSYNINRRSHNKRPSTIKSQSQTSIEEDENFKLTSAETAYYKKRQLNRMKTLVRNLDGPGSIPGVPGRDYPIYSSPPNSEFSCSNHKGRQGYFADVSTNCQVFFICSDDGHGEPVLCPNGTVFNQDVLVCDWWFNVNCRSE